MRQGKKFIKEIKILLGPGKAGREVPKILENLGTGKLDCGEHVYRILKNLHRLLL